MKKTVSFLLILVLLLSCLPLDALATEAASTITETASVEESVAAIQEETAPAETSESETTMATESMETIPVETVFLSELESDAVAPVAETVIGGSCGKHVTWSLADGVLTIRGEGAMDGYACLGGSTYMPWYNSRDSITTAVIEDGVTNIGTRAFYLCTQLEKVVIADSVTSIDPYAFIGCDNLDNVEIPNSVTVIGESAFNNCANLKKITLSGNLTTIGTGAFFYCSSLKDLKIPDSVTSVGDWAFCGCESLTEIVIPAGVTSIGSCVFAYCKGLTKVIIPDSVVSIGYAAFVDCIKLPRIDIPKSVKTIDKQAFRNCDGLTEVVIPDNVTTLGDEAFYAAEGIETVTLGKGITAINNGAFNWCSNLREVIITGHTTSIGDGTFANCPNLKKFTIPNGVTHIGAGAFSSSGLIESLIPSGVKIIKAQTYMSSDITTVAIPDSVTTIEEGAFSHSRLISVSIPNSVTTIKYRAFAVCEDLIHVNLSDNVTSIERSAFNGCLNLKLISIPGSIATISSRTFENCISLESVAISDSVTLIEYGAFNDCKNIKDVYYAGSKEQWEDIEIEKNNVDLTSATIHYNSPKADKSTYTIELYPEEETYTVGVGQELRIACFLNRGGTQVLNWKQPQIAFSHSGDEEIVTYVGWEKNSDGSYTLTIKGNHSGSEYLTIYDEDTGAVVNTLVEVTDAIVENTYQAAYIEKMKISLENYEKIISASGYGSLAATLGNAYEKANLDKVNGAWDVMQVAEGWANYSSTELSDYDLLLADLLVGVIGRDTRDKHITSNVLNNISELITEAGAGLSATEILATEQYLKDMAAVPTVFGSAASKLVSGVRSTALKNVPYKKLGDCMNILGGLVSISDAAAAGCETVQDAFDFYVLCNAYADMVTTYGDVIHSAASRVLTIDSVEEDEAGELFRRTDEFVALMHQNLNKDVESLCKATENSVANLMVTGGCTIVEGVLNITELNPVLSVLNYIFSGVKLGVTIGMPIADSLTQMDDLAYYGRMMQMCGTFSKGLFVEVQDRIAAFQEDPTYEKAQAMELASDLYARLQILACDYGIGYYTALISSNLSEWLHLNQGKDVEAMAMLQSYQNALQEAIDSGKPVYIGQDGSVYGFIANCPVTIVITDAEGKEIARLKTGEITTDEDYAGNYLLLGENGEHKAGMYDPSKHTVTLIGETEGAMDLIAYCVKDGTLSCLDSYLDVSIDNGYTAKLEVDENGQFHLIQESEEAILWGDASGDGRVNAMDATRILRYAAKLIKEDKIDLIAADVNSDGRVNAMDATRILRYAAKLIPELKVQK